MLEHDKTLMDELSIINEEFYSFEASPRQMDLLLAQGWRHFGTHFFRYSFGFYTDQIRQVIPLRIRLADFTFSKSQRRIFRKNSELLSVIRPIEVTREKQDLFELHKIRFSRGAPKTVYDFLSFSPSNVPGEACEVCLYDGDKLLAVSFFDVGEIALSSIYAMFDPSESRRSLGIMTMLLEIQFALNAGKTYFYQGYCYGGESFYDYKKRFSALEKFDWKGNWTDF